MSEGATFDVSLGSRTEPSASTAPALPIETPIVRAVRALEALKGQAEVALLLLEHCPREHGQIQAAIERAIAEMNAASAAVWHLGHLRSVEGQG